jgi:hypothetical protein
MKGETLQDQSATQKNKKTVHKLVNGGTHRQGQRQKGTKRRGVCMPGWQDATARNLLSAEAQGRGDAQSALNRRKRPLERFLGQRGQALVPPDGP